MRTLTRLAVAVVVSFPAAGGECERDAGGLPPESEPDSIIAIYRDGLVVASDVDLFSPASKDRRTTLELRVSQLVLERELVRQACESGRAGDPDVIARLANAERETASVAFKQHVAASIGITDEAIRQRYQKNIDIYVRPAMVRLQNIFLRYPAGATDSDRASIRAEGDLLHRKLLAGADFTEVALQRSDSQTRHSLGFVGFVRPGQLPSPIDAVAFALDPGEISAPIESEDGVTILKCVAVRGEETIPLHEVADTIRRTLTGQALDDRWAEIETTIYEVADLRLAPPHESDDPDAIAATCAWGGITGRGLDLLGRGRHNDRAGAARRWAVLEGTAHRARQIGLDRSPDIIRQAGARADRILADAQLEALINQRSAPPTDQAVRRFWSEHRSRFTKQETTRISVIRLSLPSLSLSQRLEEAWSLTDAIATGSITFEDAARSRSDHPSAADGGRLGALTGRELAMIAINMASEVALMQPGETSRPVVDGSTVWLIRLDDRIPARDLTWAESEAAARRLLVSGLHRTTRSEIAEALLGELAVELVRNDGH